MKFSRKSVYFLCCVVFCIFSSIIKINCSNKHNDDRDPFKSLGIPDLNPNQLLSEIEGEEVKGKGNAKEAKLQLKTIEDLPNFLKNNKMNEEDGIKVLTRFLIQDDLTLKKYGVVYDQTGFDGITSGERIAPVGTEERLVQRARSSSNIWFKQKYPKLEYDAYGAEALLDEIVPNWRIYKVLMIGKSGENTFIKTCLPLDESETALCSDKDEPCGPRCGYVEKEKKKNEEYISKIRSNGFFKKKSGLGMVKLLPGEKMVVKEKNKEIVLDSNSLNKESNPFFNNQLVDGQQANPLFAAFKNKSGVDNIGGMQVPNMNNPFNMGGAHQMGGAPQIGMGGSNPFQMGGNQPSQYNFKQKEPNTPNYLGIAPVNSNPTSNNLMMSEFLVLKQQMQQLMESMKQKDELIAQQNIKLNGFLSNNNNNIVNNPFIQPPAQVQPAGASIPSMTNNIPGQIQIPVPSNPLPTAPTQTYPFQTQQNPFSNQMNPQFGQIGQQPTIPPQINQPWGQPQPQPQALQQFNSQGFMGYQPPHFMQMPSYR